MAVARGKDGKYGFDSGKYVRYTEEQVQALEKFYSECPKPNAFRRQQLIRECPLLSNIEPKQIKVWFQNRRCREKQRKEATRLLALNEKLKAMNKVLVKQNDNLSKQAFQFVSQNNFLRRQLRLLKEQSTNLDGSKDALVTSETNSISRLVSGLRKHRVPQPPPWDVNPAWLLAFAEEALSEFLAKATGTGIDWIQIPGMKPGPDSIGVVAVAHACGGVAVQAWGVVSLEPSEVAEALRDKVSWLCDCRQMEVLGTFDSTDGRKLELLHTQMYAPITLASPRSFYTLRYTSNLEDGSLVICERSLSAAQGMPMVSQSQSFVHGELLSSGYLIRPCEGRGALVIMVDHRNLEASSVPEALRPLYESSTFFAQKMTVEASYHLQGKVQPEMISLSKKLQQPCNVRSYSQRLCRGFNEAVNTLPDDGWMSLSKDGLGDVTICVKSLSNCRNQMSSSNSLCSTDMGILSVKASLLLQEVSPTMLARFLREHRTEWMDYELNFNYKASYCQNTQTAGLHGSFRQVSLPLTQSADQDESLEVIKLESTGEETNIKSNETFILQLCNGISGTTASGWAQLVFAPVDASLSDELPLLPSGFRIITINNYKDQCCLSRTLDLTSHLEGGSEGCRFHTAGDPDVLCYSSVLTVAFQFKYEAQIRDLVTVKAHHYAQRVLEFIRKAAVLIMPACETSQKGRNPSVCSLESKILVYHIVQKYRNFFGMDLFKTETAVNADILFKAFWNHKDAIICCTSKHIPEYVFANQAGLDMLETTAASLPGLPWLKTVPENEKQAAYKDLLQVLQQEYSYMPAGIRISSNGRPVAYERAMAWNVLDSDNSICVVTVMFMNWSFLT